MIIDPDKQVFKDNYKLMIGSIVPRPIAFVSTVSKDGIRNLAPFSFFNGVCSNPPTIMFAPVRRSSDGEIKDTVRNIQDTKQFVINIVSEDFAQQMVATSTEFAPEVDEFEAADLTPVDSQKVIAPRVGEARVSFECELQQIVEIGDGSPGSGFAVFGTIVLFHIADELYEYGRINLRKLNPVGRLAGSDGYCRVTDIFSIERKTRPDS